MLVFSGTYQDRHLKPGTVMDNMLLYMIRLRMGLQSLICPFICTFFFLSCFHGQFVTHFSRGQFKLESSNLGHWWTKLLYWSIENQTASSYKSLYSIIFLCLSFCWIFAQKQWGSSIVQIRIGRPAGFCLIALNRAHLS